MASKQEINDLAASFGGFEYWPILDEDCRMEVVKFLDFKGRKHLGLCSKADYSTVDKTPMDIHILSIAEKNIDEEAVFEEGPRNIILRVETTTGQLRKPDIWLEFSQVGRDTNIKCLRCEANEDYDEYEDMQEFSLLTWTANIFLSYGRWFLSWFIPPRRCAPIIKRSSNYQVEAIVYYEKYMKKCNYKMENIKVGIPNYPIEITDIRPFTHCENTEIGVDSVQHFNFWMEKLENSPLESMEVESVPANTGDLVIPTESLNWPQIMTVPSLTIRCRAAMTDEQFLRLENYFIVLDRTDVTDKGVNGYLKKWASGERSGRVILSCRNGVNQTTVLQGLIYRKWDDEYNRETNGFLDRLNNEYGEEAEYFQIQSFIDDFKSVTLSIDDIYICIWPTGEKATDRDGRVYTRYSIPS